MNTLEKYNAIFIETFQVEESDLIRSPFEKLRDMFEKKAPPIINARILFRLIHPDLSHSAANIRPTAANRGQPAANTHPPLKNSNS